MDTSYLFYEANITLIQKPDKYREENYRQIYFIKINKKFLTKY